MHENPNHMNSNAKPHPQSNWKQAILRCPRSKAELIPATAELICHLHELQNVGKLVNHLGMNVRSEFDAGWISINNEWFYMSKNGIPSLLPDDAISMSEFSIGLESKTTHG